MKKLTLTLALFTCLALLLFAFASCGKKEGTTGTTADVTAAETAGESTGEATAESTTGAPTVTEPEATSAPTAAETTAAETTADPFAHVHVPESEYWIDLEPTCTTPGSKSLYCEECGEQITESIVEIPIDPTAHKVNNWEVTSVASLLNPTGHRSGVCQICEKTVEEDVAFTHNVQVFTTSKGKYTAGYSALGDIRGGKHFYEEGNDLLVEYSVLWNETVLNLYGLNGTMPTIDTRFTQTEAGTSGNSGIVRWELASDVQSQWCTCKFAGGFEVAAHGTNEPDNPYPRFGETVDDITAYPNIGGANLGDGQPLGETQWGWHRVSIRYHEEVTNLDDVKNGENATYKLQVWVYIDGDLVLHSSGTDHVWGGDNSDRKLFSARPDNAGGVTYVENDHLYLHGAFLDSTRMTSGTGYFEIADYSATIGNEFVQKVVKVSNPEPATLTVAEGVELPASMYYKLAD